MKRLISVSLLALVLSGMALGGDVPAPGAVPTPTPTPECGDCTVQSSTTLTLSNIIEIVWIVTVSQP